MSAGLLPEHRGFITSSASVISLSAVKPDGQHEKW